jgi:hypothetical protein
MGIRVNARIKNLVQGVSGLNERRLPKPIEFLKLAILDSPLEEGGRQARQQVQRRFEQSQVKSSSDALSNVTSAIEHDLAGKLGRWLLVQGVGTPSRISGCLGKCPS